VGVYGEQKKFHCRIHGKAEKGKAEALELKNKYESELNEAYAKAQKILKKQRKKQSRNMKE